MSEQHALSDDQVRGRYCDGTYLQTGHTTDGHEFDAWLARARRDAKAEAWDEAASHAERKAWVTNFRADDLRTANPYCYETGGQR